jgi:hypothetical protein
MPSRTGKQWDRCGAYYVDHAIVGGDDAVAASWLKNHNTVLDGQSFPPGLLAIADEVIE